MLNFRKFKEGLKEKKNVLEHHQTVERHPKVGGQLFGVRLPIFKFYF